MLPPRPRPSARRAAAAAVEADPRWARVRARDPAADGAFVYAVRTTGVCCRPSCPSRRPRPDHVEFHADVAAARAAGFRACRRCAPEGPAPASVRAARVATLCRRLERDGPTPTLADLGRLVGLSPFHVARVFRAATGVTVRAYAAAHRARRARATLRTRPTVAAAHVAAGYGSASRFYATAAARLGMTPRAYRAGGAGLELRYTTARCDLGTVLVAATPRGIAAILLGDAEGPLVRDLARRFPRATRVRDAAGLASRVRDVVRAVAEPHLAARLPLDVRGTAFQQRVWAALTAVPAGATTTYAAVARTLGAPRAVRAVAGACAANPAAVAIPCHRVRRTDGALAGYRWGVARKRALLAREAAATTGGPRRTPPGG